MENANKALIIAGAVLIAIVILSVGVYLFVKFSNQNKNYKEMVSNIEMQKFNSKFEAYTNRTDITPQEVVSAMYLAKEYPNITVNAFAGGYAVSQDHPENILGWYSNDTFSCLNYTYSQDGRITSITFTKN